jgi:hypothetical protein
MTEKNGNSNQSNQSYRRELVCEECAAAHFSKEDHENSLSVTWGEEVRGNRIYNLFKKNSHEALDRNRRSGEKEPEVVMINGKIFIEY